MDINDMRDRINPMHADMLRRMLKLNELPDFLLERYFTLKKILDPVDGVITACDLLRIALDCGFNPETRLFEKDTVQADVSGVPHGLGTEQPKLEEEFFQKPEKDPEPPTPEEFAKTDNTEPVAELEQQITEPEPETAEIELDPEPEEVEVHKIGLPVSVWHDGDEIRGHINGSDKDDAGIYYSIDTGEEVLEDIRAEDIKV